jgi:uncharacterized protein (TIGR02452 family)
MNRTQAAQLARDTVRILEARRYTNPAGAVVELGDLLDACVQGVRSYPPEHDLTAVQLGTRTTQIEVENESTLAAAQRLVQAGLRPVALNFASAKHPGGGFLGGARAQEESLARSSGLYACLVGNAMYDFHKVQGDPMYSNYAIYAPDVPVLRDDEGLLLAQPYLCSFITSPAVNAKVVLERNRSARPQIREAMRQRIGKVLTIATLHGHEALVLGAWGCGVFGNNTRQIAEQFHQALTGDFRGVFGRVIFAVLDWSEERRFIAHSPKSSRLHERRDPCLPRPHSGRKARKSGLPCSPGSSTVSGRSPSSPMRLHSPSRDTSAATRCKSSWRSAMWPTSISLRPRPTLAAGQGGFTF